MKYIITLIMALGIGNMSLRAASTSTVDTREARFTGLKKSIIESKVTNELGFPAPLNMFYEIEFSGKYYKMHVILSEKGQLVKSVDGSYHPSGNLDYIPGISPSLGTFLRMSGDKLVFVKNGAFKKFTMNIVYRELGEGTGEASYIVTRGKNFNSYNIGDYVAELSIELSEIA